MSTNTAHLDEWDGEGCVYVYSDEDRENELQEFMNKPENKKSVEGWILPPEMREYEPHTRPEMWTVLDKKESTSGEIDVLWVKCLCKWWEAWQEEIRSTDGSKGSSTCTSLV